MDFTNLFSLLTAVFRYEKMRVSGTLRFSIIIFIELSGTISKYARSSLS